MAALGLQPLELEERGPWDPSQARWEDPEADWAKAIIARGPRTTFEMEQALPGRNPTRWDGDPIVVAAALSDAGDSEGARKRLMKLLEQDLRCLDSHAHLGNLLFDSRPEDAVRHYEVGVGIGDLSVGPSFDGLLPWGFIDNRPFLRCLQGYGLCLWRLGRHTEAADLFLRMLSLNPVDNQGIRVLLGPVRGGESWEHRCGAE